jgi:hypothetical protein
MSRAERLAMVDPAAGLSMRRQCELLGLGSVRNSVFTELPQVTDIARSAFILANVLRIRRSGSEQFHARLSPNNATRLSGMEWLWSAKRA